MNLIDIGLRIRKHREFLGYSREEFAEQLDITPKFCSDIELGIKGMSVQTLCKIASVLHLSVDYILFGNENNTCDADILEMLNTCPPEKTKYLTEIIKQFILSLNDND